MGVPLDVASCFSLAAFNIFPFKFWQFNYYVSHVHPLGSFFRTLRASWIWMSLSFPMLEKFSAIISLLKTDFIYLFLERGEGREKERERNIDVREKRQSIASHTHPNWGSKPATWACALTGNWTCNLLVYRMMLQPTEPPGQGFLNIPR